MSSPSSRRTTRHRRHKRGPGRKALAISLALLIVLGAGSALGYLSVKDRLTTLEVSLLSNLRAGQAELELGKASLRQANTTHDINEIAHAKAHFVNAEAHFRSAIDVADHSTLLRQLEDLPDLGTSVKARHGAVDGVSSMGIQLAQAGDHIATLDGELIKPADAGQQGQGLLNVVGQVETALGPLTDELTRALAAAERVDASVLPASEQATFARAKGTISLALGTVKQFQALVPVMTEVLGGNGARTYLVEQVNPAELRPGGGFIGTYSILHADRGALTLIKSGNAADLVLPRASVGQPGYVAPPLPFEQFIPGTGWSFIDSNFFVDFPSNAASGANFAESHLRLHIDGVIAVDYYTVAGLLTVTGPIAVPGYAMTLTADSFVATVVRYDLESYTDPSSDAIHKAILSAVAGPLLQRIVNLQASQWPTLLGILNSLAGGRDIQMYFTNSAVEKTMTQYGWSGVLETTAKPDYMMEVEANLGGTKANYYVTRHYTVELTRIGPVLHHKVSVDITDNMAYSWRPNEYYHAYIEMLTSGTADSMLDDLSHPQHQMAAPPGTNLLDGWILIHGYCHDRVVTFNWNTPWTPNGRRVEQIYWQKQPGTQADKVDVVWNDANGHTYKVNGDLGQDRVITLAPNGVSLTQGQVGTAQLPSLSLG